MWPYWLIFLLPALLAANEGGRFSAINWETRQPPITRLTSAWWGTSAVLILLVGWRHEVGADWTNYIENFHSAIYDSQFVEWWKNDPGYRLLEWIAIQNAWDIHAVNLMGAVFFVFGLVIFCCNLPRPWLALAVAVPYLVIIVGMGYSRQGVALGCIMAGLAFLGRGQLFPFLVWAVFGATFHKSAILLLPMAALAASRRKMTVWVWVAVVVVISYYLLLENSLETLNTNYLEAEYQSEGALVRLLMNVLPATLLLFKYQDFSMSLPRNRLWYWFSLASLILFGIYFFSPSSTAVDRVALYLLPLQLMVFSHLPGALGRDALHSKKLVFWILAYYGTVEFVWLNFATHAPAWLPYRFFPFE